MSEPVSDPAQEPTMPPEQKLEKKVDECPEDQHKWIEDKRVEEATAVWVYERCEICGKKRTPYNAGKPN